MEFELKTHGVPYTREVRLAIDYKGKILPHHYIADFDVENKIDVEIKAIEKLAKPHVRQTLNHLTASKLKLGLLINFGEYSLSYKRVILQPVFRLF